MADNGYDPRAQAMEEIHFDWRCIVCCMVALSPLHLEQQHLPGTESVYFDLDNTPWVKCDKCHTPFHLQCGTLWNLFKLSDPNVFFVLFFVVDSFRSPCHLCCSYSPPFPMLLVLERPPHHSPCRLYFVLSQSFDFKMGRKRMCPDSDKKRKKTSPETEAVQSFQVTRNVSGFG